MNKGIIIGIVIVVIIGIGVIFSMSFSENTEKEILVSDDELILDEIIPVEEDIEEPEKTGRDISIELKETVGLSSP